MRWKVFFYFFDKWYRSCRYSDYACQIDITLRKKRCLSRLCNWKTNIFTLLFLHGLHITVILYPAKVTASIFHLSFCLETKQQKNCRYFHFFLGSWCKCPYDRCLKFLFLFCFKSQVFGTTRITQRLTGTNIDHGNVILMYTRYACLMVNLSNRSATGRGAIAEHGSLVETLVFLPLLILFFCHCSWHAIFP